MTPSSNCLAALCEIIQEVREKPAIPATEAERWLFDSVLMDLSAKLLSESGKERPCLPT